MKIKNLIIVFCFLFFLPSVLCLNISIEKTVYPATVEYKNPNVMIVIKIKNFENKTFSGCKLYDTFPVYAEPVNKEKKITSGLPFVFWEFSIKPNESKIFSYNLTFKNPPRKSKKLEISLYSATLEINGEYINSNSPSIILTDIPGKGLKCNFNFICEPEKGESPLTCPQDCYSLICGNGLCEKGENPSNCPQDCNLNLTCGNKKCEPFENYTTCCVDCPCPKGKICINNTCVDIKTFCGNSICESFENYKICSKDCPSGSEDNYCDGVQDNICDPDCKEQKEFDPDCVPKSNLWIYILLAVFAVFIGLIYYETRKKFKPKEEYLYGAK